jgi:predicted alpha/beta hydrolase
MHAIKITAADGYELSAIFGTPVGTSTGTIVLSSAVAVKKEFYISFAKYLIQNGYNVLLYDYRGVGGSAPANLRSSKAYMHEWGTLDMNAVLNYMVDEKGLTNIIWLGHSVGAQLARCVDKKQHLQKVIAVNAALGYWGYFPFPMRAVVWTLWYVISPVLVKIYGYGKMQKVKWGENLPRNIFLEWRDWCISKHYYRGFLQDYFNADKFYDFTTPLTFVYTSDDYIVNDKTTALMMNFFPYSPQEVLKLEAKDFTNCKVGHTGIFRKKFHNNLWAELLTIIEGKRRCNLKHEN